MAEVKTLKWLDFYQETLNGSWIVMLYSGSDEEQLDLLKEFTKKVLDRVRAEIQVGKVDITNIPKKDEYKKYPVFLFLKRGEIEGKIEGPLQILQYLKTL